VLQTTDAAQLNRSGHFSVQDKQQQQQGVPRPASLRQAVTVDPWLENEWMVEFQENLKRTYAPTLVGYWCAAWSALTLAALRLCEDLWEAALSRGRHGLQQQAAAERPTGLPGAAQNQVLKVAAMLLVCLLLGLFWLSRDTPQMIEELVGV
jgi:hypothetical protein